MQCLVFLTYVFQMLSKKNLWAGEGEGLARPLGKGRVKQDDLAADDANVQSISHLKDIHLEIIYLNEIFCFRLEAYVSQWLETETKDIHPGATITMCICFQLIKVVIALFVYR